MKGPLGASPGAPLPAADLAPDHRRASSPRCSRPRPHARFVGPGLLLPQAGQRTGLRSSGSADSLTGRFIDSVVVRVAAPRSAGPYRPMDLPATQLGHDRRDRSGAIVAVAVLVLLWRRRRVDAGPGSPLGTGASSWRSGRRSVRYCSLMVGGGVKANNYVMHDNDFCRGCHIFVPSGQIFVRPDTGTYLLVNQLEGKHDSLSCHACHPFDLRPRPRSCSTGSWRGRTRSRPMPRCRGTICEQCHVRARRRRPGSG